MPYRTGDYVYPRALPRRLLCRVLRAEERESFQILTLEPVDGPWCGWPETRLVVRLDDDVEPARARELWLPARA
jgi:hypothetical protein